MKKIIYVLLFCLVTNFGYADGIVVDIDQTFTKAGSGVNSDITSLTALDGSDLDMSGGYLLDNQNFTDLQVNGPGYWFDGIDSSIGLTSATYDLSAFSFVVQYQKDAVAEGRGLFNRLGVSGNSHIKFSAAGNVFMESDDGSSQALGALLDDTKASSILAVISTENVVSMFQNGSSMVVTGTASFTDDITLDTIGSDGVNSPFSGAINLFRVFNVALDNTDITDKAIINGGDIPFKYIGANQTELTSGTLVTGKAYRINDWITTDDFTNIGGTNEDGNEFVATGTTPTTWTNSSTVVQIGCIFNLNKDSIGHQQWLDTSGNEVNGTVSGALPISLTPNHLEKYIDLTVTDDTSFTVPAGYKINSIILFNTTANAVTGGINIGLSAGAEEVVANFAVGANALVECTILQSFFSTTADDVIYVNDVTSWNSASLEMYVQMERIK